MISQTNKFTTYEFTDEELLEACKLTILQKAFIQHQLGIAADDKLNIKFDPKTPEVFMQDEAHITGQIFAYQFLLSSADWSAEQIREGIAQQQLEQRKANEGNLLNPRMDPNQISQS